jgi:16S rRNA (cytidine1402-2'-O)-methyltransferase
MASNEIKIGHTSKGKLIICPTPLGNLGDITKRTLEAFSQCDVVCCEDTRVTGKLLSVLGIKKSLERLDEATLGSKAEYIAQRVLSGEIIAYASDAGMPGVSDPGQRLVDAALEVGAVVEVLPGPTALTTAYVASGFSARSFYFGAFFPRKEGERKRLLSQLKPLDAVLIFYESPLRLVSALGALKELVPYRRVAVCRELTKIHEEVVRGTIDEVLRVFVDREKQEGIKGEIVLVIEAPNEQELIADKTSALLSAEERVSDLLNSGQYSKKDIVRILKDEFGLTRNDAYELVHHKGQIP